MPYTEVSELCCYHLINVILKVRNKLKNILPFSVHELLVGARKDVYNNFLPTSSVLFTPESVHVVQR